MPDVTEATIEAESGLDYSYTLDYDYGILGTGAITQSFTMTGGADLSVTGTQTHLQTFTFTGGADLAFSPTQLQTASYAMAGGGDLRLDTKFVSGVPSKGWHVVVIHPTTGRRMVAQVLDRDPAILPSLNSLPEIRIPVRKDPAWLDLPDDADPPMLVWLDGERQPIDQLREVEERPDHTVLVGIGATELRQRVQKEVRSGRRHDEARSLITNETGYSEDVDTPAVETLTGQVQFDSSTTTGFDADTDFADDVPLTTAGDEITTAQTCFTTEGEGVDSSSGVDVFTADRFSGDSATDGAGQALRYTDTGQSGSWQFTPLHDIPAADLEVQVRIETEDSPKLEMSLNGETWNIVSDGQDTSLGWRDYASAFDSSESDGYEGGGLSAGTTYTLTIDSVTSGGTNAVAYVDVVAPLDRGSRFDDGPFSYTLDNSVTTGGDNGRYLDGPETHPNITNAASVDNESAFSITDGDATITMDDTTGNQRLQISNDRGENWFPNDGTEDNTTSVSTDFNGNTGASIRMRVTLDRYSPNGTRDQTPREGYDGQSILSWELNADVDLELLLTDYKEDQTIAAHLNQIATDTEFVWSANIDSSGDYQVSWTQPGQRTASDDLDIGDFSVTKDMDVYDLIAIEGSNRNVSGGTFTASNTFVPTSPEYDDIVSGSETVYDDSGTNYDRNADYEMDYSNGEIRRIDGGRLTNGEVYNIDFEVETLGTYPSDVSNPDREFVETVPGITSDRAAQQIAYLLFTEFETPRYEGTLTLPRADVSFDPLDALTLENLDLPDAATPLEPRGDPSITPTGLEIRLGNRGRIEQALGEIAAQVRAVSKNV